MVDIFIKFVKFLEAKIFGAGLYDKYPRFAINLETNNVI